MSIIKIENLSKSYGPKVALSNVSLEIPEGKIFGLLGPNGAGKTTLIRIINRIIMPTSGEVYFKDAPITSKDVQKIGYLPEERGLYRKMKVGDQAMYFAQLKGMTASQARESLKNWFIKFGIQDWWGKKVEELSKGMAQKVQFITTVCHNPSLLILDEPFSGFDPVNAQIIRDEILRLKSQGSTIILSTHNMESVEELCDEIALINKSKVVVSGGVDEIRHKYGSNNLQLIYTSDKALTAGESFSILSDEDDNSRHTAVISVADSHSANEVLGEILAQNVRINSFQELIPRMNDIFIKLVTEGE